MTSNPQSDRNLDLLDRIVLTEDTLLPSSGFAASVMDEIKKIAAPAQATQPAPIPFPWKLALPGIAALLAIIIWLTVSAIHTMSASTRATGSLPQVNFDLVMSPALMSPVLRAQVVPALLALAASWLCIVLCRRLAGGWSTR